MGRMLALATGLLGFVVGVVCGMLLRAGEPAADAAATLAVGPAKGLDSADQDAGFAAGARSLEDRLALGLNALEARLDAIALQLESDAGAPVTRVEVPTEADDATASRNAGERLLEIERKLDRLLAMGAGGRASPELPMPLGMAVPAYLQALKQYTDDGSEEQVNAAHALWSEAQVRAAYGPPSRIEDNEDYVEWIYDLPNEDQFDFHFVNGLCTRAH